MKDRSYIVAMFDSDAVVVDGSGILCHPYISAATERMLFTVARALPLTNTTWGALGTSRTSRPISTTRHFHSSTARIGNTRSAAMACASKNDKYEEAVFAVG